MYFVFLCGIIVCACAAVVAYIRGKRDRKEENTEMQWKKTPKYVLIIDIYNRINEKYLEELKRKYRIEKMELYKKKLFELEHKSLVTDIIEEYGDIKHNNVCAYVDKHAYLFPDLIILCSDVSYYLVDAPYLLYKAEMVHCRKSFTEAILLKGLLHYSSCIIRNGR